MESLCGLCSDLGLESSAADGRARLGHASAHVRVETFDWAAPLQRAFVAAKAARCFPPRPQGVPAKPRLTTLASQPPKGQGSEARRKAEPLGRVQRRKEERELIQLGSDGSEASVVSFQSSEASPPSRPSTAAASSAPQPSAEVVELSDSEGESSDPFFCRLCRRRQQTSLALKTAQFQHVVRKHLGGLHLVSCRECAFSEPFRRTASTHAFTRHTGRDTVLDATPRHASRINGLLRQAFCRPQLLALRSAKRKAKAKDSGGSTPWRPPPDALLCRVCRKPAEKTGKALKSPEGLRSARSRHVHRVHLRTPRFVCGECRAWRGERRAEHEKEKHGGRRTTRVDVSARAKRFMERAFGAAALGEAGSSQDPQPSTSSGHSTSQSSSKPSSEPSQESPREPQNDSDIVEGGEAAEEPEELTQEPSTSRSVREPSEPPGEGSEAEPVELDSALSGDEEEPERASTSAAAREPPASASEDPAEAPVELPEAPEELTEATESEAEATETDALEVAEETRGDSGASVVKVEEAVPNSEDEPLSDSFYSSPEVTLQDSPVK